MLSIVIPLYKSEPNLPRLFSELTRVASLSPIAVELVFVNDGSPDRCGDLVAARLGQLGAPAQLVTLTRNFGAFAAISAGLQHARGDYFAVMAADLQEPPDLALEFLSRLASGQADIVFGARTNRRDPALTMLASRAFWALYRRLVNPEIPKGGVDVFGCTRRVRDEICSMKEVETSLVGLLFWIGFRRAFVPYERQPRREGRSAWTVSKKLGYLLNSVFNFTDLPIRLLMLVGGVGMTVAILGATVVLGAKLGGTIQVPGYAATVLTLLFFGGLTGLGLGIVGQYVWLTLQNARNRPSFIVQSRVETERDAP